MAKDLLLYENITQLVTMRGVARKKGRHTTAEDLDVISNAALVVDNESSRIEWLGPQGELPKSYEDIDNRVSASDSVWLPELVECHTHLVFGGTRHHDYALRCGGLSYQQVAEQGGGILSTIKHTRESSFQELFEGAQAEIDRFQKYGVGVIEAKSGYGLSLESELNLLKCIHALAQTTSVRLVPTFLPAHAVPPEFKGRADDYVDVICREWIPEVAKKNLAVFFDAFVETGYFSVEQTRKMCEVAKENGLAIKLHTDQFNDIGGTELAISVGATSCDHLDNISEANISRLGKSDTVAVVCPGASLFTGTPYPPARRLIDSGARVAISTDYNPGTCPSRNLPLMTTLACSQLKMTIPEAIAGITYNAAAALGLEAECGVLDVGREFRVCTLKADSYEVLPYSFGELD
jgi:imidazolonepropionase